MGAFLLAGLTGLGLLNFYEEKDGLAMWLPTDSPYRKNTEWLRATNPASTRAQTMLVVTKNGGNILSAKNVQVGK